MNKKIFSGVQPTGNLHLGNYLGAIKNFVELQNDKKNECIYCVVDLHSITVKQDAKILKKKLDYKHPLNQLGLNINSKIFKEDFSQIKTYLFKKLLKNLYF